MIGTYKTMLLNKMPNIVTRSWKEALFALILLIAMLTILIVFS